MEDLLRLSGTSYQPNGCETAAGIPKSFQLKIKNRSCYSKLCLFIGRQGTQSRRRPRPPRVQLRRVRNRAPRRRRVRRRRHCKHRPQYSECGGADCIIKRECNVMYSKQRSGPTDPAGGRTRPPRSSSLPPRQSTSLPPSTSNYSPPVATATPP